MSIERWRWTPEGVRIAADGGFVKHADHLLEVEAKENAFRDMEARAFLAEARLRELRAERDRIRKALSQRCDDAEENSERLIEQRGDAREEAAGLQSQLSDLQQRVETTVSWLREQQEEIWTQEPATPGEIADRLEGKEGAR